MRVDDDAVPAFEPGLAGERVLGGDADADEDEIGRQDLAVASARPPRPCPSPGSPRRRRPRNEPRAERPVRLGIEVRQDRRHRAAHRPGDLDHRRLGAELGRGRRDLEPDEARADHDDPEAGGDPFAQGGRVGDVAQREHAGQIDAGDVEPPLPRAGRQNQMAVADRRAVGEFDRPRRAVDPGRARRRA